MPDAFEISTILPAHPQDVYRAWMDEATHAEIIGASASISAAVGGEFRMWDGYVVGRTLELEPPKRIVQAWRTTDFAESDPDSRLELQLESIQGGTRLTLRHSGIPEGQGASYEEGWETNYFAPMRAYFSASRS